MRANDPSSIGISAALNYFRTHVSFSTTTTTQSLPIYLMLQVDRFGKMAALKHAAQSPYHQPYGRYLALVASMEIGSGCAYFWGPFWCMQSWWV
jgi:hypothetical protein